MEPSRDPPDVTRLLREWSDGDPAALQRLIPLVYQDLRRLARRARRSEGPDSPQTTTLVHEAYLRLARGPLSLRDRGHFFALAARVMRRLLIDEARARGALRRGGGALLEPPEGAGPPVDLLALDVALRRLSALDPRQGRLVELRYFGGLTEAETAEALGISVATLKREWTVARAWLYRALQDAAP